MIRTAPVAFLVTSCVLAAIVYWWMGTRYGDQISDLQITLGTKDATIKKQGVDSHYQELTVTNLQNTITQLQEQLKGASPQLAALQANRDKIRKQLQLFYILGGDLLSRSVSDQQF